MPDWLHAEFRDFHEFPRTMVCSNSSGCFLFLSRFDEAKDEYADYYEVYRIQPLSGSETCDSWFGIETHALERLPDLPVRAFPFDVGSRRFLPYDAIADLLEPRSET